MRIKGPSGGIPPIDETGGAAPTEASAPVTGSAGAGEVAATEGPQAIVKGRDLVGEVARRLRAGELTPRDAVELLIDDAVGRQIGRITVGRETVAAELKDLLRRYTETDPFLASKVRRLGNKS